MGNQRKRFSDQLRQLIRDSGMTPYRIAQELGIERSTLSRFMNDKAGLKMETLDALGELLHWTVNAKPPR